MRHGRAPFVALALFFLARAGAAQAGEVANPAVLAPAGGGEEPSSWTQDDLNIADVTVELSTLAVAADELLLTGEMAAPADAVLLTGELVEAGTGEIEGPLFGRAPDAAGAAAHDDALLGDEALFGAAAGTGDAALASAAAAGDAALFASNAAERISDAELSEQRGGFAYQGLDIRLGAEVRAYLGDELVVQTNFSWTDAALATERIVSTALTPGALAGLQAGMLSGSGLNLRAGDDVFLANEGQTAFIQRAEGALQNIIINSASNVSLRHEIDARIDIANFAPFQSRLLADQVVSALAGMSAGALIGGISR